MMKRTAFTMIELVFVIVILGILAAVAIPKLAATRDDAVNSGLAQNIVGGAGEIAAYATANGDVLDDLTLMSNGMKSLVDTGAGVSEPKKMTVTRGADTECIVVEITTSGGTDTLTITASSSSDSQCLILQSLIDTSIYPMVLRGTNVVL